MQKAMKRGKTFNEEKGQKTNPNETRGSEGTGAADTEQSTCPNCLMEKSEWTGNAGKGVQQDQDVYCCQGCAEDTGCTCADDR